MRRTRLLVATAATAALLVGATTVGAAPTRPSQAGTASAEAQADARDGRSRLFGGLLTGAAEVPGPGDPDGAGLAVIRLNVPNRRICVLGFATNQIDPPTLFHIHEGVATVAGPIVVDFTHLLPEGTGCVRVERSLARAIQQNPDGYYFNVHNPAFPAGAVRATVTAF